MSKYTATRNRIRALRLAKAWSAADLRDEIQKKMPEEKVSSSAILKIEKGAMKLSERWQRIIADVLGVQPWELQGDEDPGVPVLRMHEIVTGRRAEGDTSREFVPWPIAPHGLLAFRARDRDAGGDIKAGDVVVLRTSHQVGWPLTLCMSETGDIDIKEIPDGNDIIIGDVIHIQRDLRDRFSIQVAEA